MHLKKHTYNIIIAAVGYCCFFLQACENDANQVEGFYAKKNTNNETATDVTLQYTVFGKPKAVLTAPLLLRIQDSISYYEFPKTVHTTFYNEQQQQQTLVDALYGKYSDQNNTVYLRDCVKIVNIARGDTIFCDDLYWDRSHKGTEFFTEKKVRIKQINGQYVIGLNGLEADEGFKNIHIRTGFGRINAANNILPN
jgi:LPS export ABC transporter protein LptC